MICSGFLVRLYSTNLSDRAGKQFKNGTGSGPTGSSWSVHEADGSDWCTHQTDEWPFLMSYLVSPIFSEMEIRNCARHHLLALAFLLRPCAMEASPQGNRVNLAPASVDRVIFWYPVRIPGEIRPDTTVICCVMGPGLGYRDYPACTSMSRDQFGPRLPARLSR